MRLSRLCMSGHADCSGVSAAAFRAHLHEGAFDQAVTGAIWPEMLMNHSPGGCVHTVKLFVRLS